MDNDTVYLHDLEVEEYDESYFPEDVWEDEELVDTCDFILNNNL